ncbi:DNA-dependent RNA polymerase subunit epsilon [Saliterribacillus persicus]|uniref:DNA-directed RNA polymerase subunit epsilon n=1 Tax=Saliterribacillus persicus TaxID=930114 RepID=A0A368XV53_9BACI|nr:RNA polymerase epsilon subunit [Saliterribacillus persicus]RCW71832.1 DNA-dependent RNA polymerase auxiliary subunit epsilon [Saliterribacillus persicus]
MIYKVLYQEKAGEVPVREHTKSVFVEANSEREVRKHLAERNFNIEYVHAVSDEHLNYEKASDTFKVEKR